MYNHTSRENRRGEIADFGIFEYGIYIPITIQLFIVAWAFATLQGLTIDTPGATRGIYGHISPTLTELNN